MNQHMDTHCLILVGHLRGLFSASCIDGSFAGHLGLSCGGSLMVSILALENVNENRARNYCSRGGHLYVPCWSICDWDQVFWSTRCVLDHLSSLQKLLIAWFFTVQRWNWSHAFLIFWFSEFRSDLDILISTQKRALIAWFNFDPNQKCFDTGHMTTLCCWKGNPTCTVRRSSLVLIVIMLCLVYA